jgi:hypothetical protein
VEAREATQRWIAGWLRGWIDHDADRVAALYAPGAFFLSAPFREPEEPRTWVLQAFAEEDSAEPWFGEPIVDGDRAAVEWRATIRSEDKELTLAGASLLRFREDGLCIEQRDAWEMREGRLPRTAHFE